MEGRLVLVEKLDILDDTIVRTESKLDERKGFQCTWKGAKVQTSVSYTSVVTRNKFYVLEDETCDEPGFVLVGDSLIRHQDEEVCRKGPMKKYACYPGRKKCCLCVMLVQITL